jgi:pimeloyl-ACP methyl ester carboxylesterase
MAQKALKRTGLVAGATAGAIGLANATERALVARLRHRDDPDAGDSLVPEFDEARILDSHDGGTIYTISRGGGNGGDAPVVVFCHGVTLSSRVWAKQFASFPAAGFRAVAFDSRGHGESLAGDTGHSLDNLADDLRTVLEELDLRNVVLVGHSMGGMTVQAFAIRHPDVVAERVVGLVLLSTSSHNLVSDAKRVRGAVEKVVSFGPDVGTFMRQRNLGLLLANIGFGDDPHPSQVEATREMLAECDKATTREALTALLHLDLTEGLPKVQVPTLVVVGTADALTPPRDARRIAALMPNATLVEYEGGGHMLMYERTAEVDALIMDFARGVQTSDVETDEGPVDAAGSSAG